MLEPAKCLGSSCPTVLLDDSPTVEDSFRHVEIARAIAQMILHENGGRAIALTGAWGTGKSTVVHMLEAELRNADAPTKVVIFDAWAHQGDPLRRTFIEHAMAALDEWKPSGNQWKRQLDILSRRWTQSVTSSHPELSFLGAAGALALLVSPVANQLFGLLRPEHGTPSLAVNFLFLLGTSPLIIGLGIFSWWLYKRLRDGKAALPSLIYSASENTTTTSTSRTPEPTSIEFADAYRSLLTDVLGTKDRRVVFVVDNLDRVNDEEGKAIWATLKAFFDSPFRKEKWYARVWLLVPFDERAIKRLWGNNENEKSDGAQFIEKTFQAFFRVPSTQLSSWEAYFFQQFVIAFPRHTDAAERQTIFRLFDLLRVDTATPPTPRQIKLFLNTLGSLHRQWHEQIPLTTQAAFCLAVIRSKDFVGELRSSDRNQLLPFDLGRRLPGDWQLDMSALYFNVPRTAASETLLGYPTSQALLRGSGPALVELSNSFGFKQVLAKQFEERYTLPTVVEQDQLVNLALALGALDDTDITYQECWRILQSQFSQVDMWSELGDKTASAIVALLKADIGFPSESLRKNILASLKPKGKLLPVDDLNAWSKLMSGAMPTVLDRLEEDSDHQLVLNTSAREFITVTTVLRQAGAQGLMPNIKPQSEPAQVVEELEKDVVGEGWSAESARAVAFLSDQYPDWDWASLVSALVTRLGTTMSDAKVVSDTVFSLTKFLTSKPGYRDSLSQLNGEEALANLELLASAAKLNRVSEFEALILLSPASLIQVTPPPQQPNHGYYYQQQAIAQLSPTTAAANEGRKRVLATLNSSTAAFPSLKAATLRLGDLAFWREASVEDESRKPFVEAWAKSEPVSTLTQVNLSAQDFVQEHDFWRDTLGEERYKREAEGAAVRQELSGALENFDFDTSLAPLYVLALLTQRTDGLIRVLKGALNAFTVTQWAAELAGRTATLDIIPSVGERWLGQAFEQALFNKAAQELAAGSQCKKDVESTGLTDALSPDSKERFLSKLVNAFADGDGSFAGALPCWGPQLQQGLLDVGPDRAQERLSQSLLSVDNIEMRWISELLLAWGTANPKAPALRKRLKQTLQQIDRKELSAPQESAVRNFATALGWKDLA